MKKLLLLFVSGTPCITTIAGASGNAYTDVPKPPGGNSLTFPGTAYIDVPQPFSANGII